jgi:hypothetical protein
MSDLEARARLSSVLDVLQREVDALRRLSDPRLDDVIEAIVVLQAEIVATLGALHDASTATATLASA